MMTGITQGYTKNLELRGIGYQGKIIEQPDSRRRFAVEASIDDGGGYRYVRRAPRWGQLENKIGEMRSMQKNLGAGVRAPRLASPCPSGGSAIKNFLVLNLG